MALKTVRLINLTNPKSSTDLFSLLIKKRNLFILPILVVFISLVLFIFIVVPRFRQVIALNNELNNKKTLLNNLTAKLADLDGIDEFLLKEKVDLALGALPNKKNVMELISSLKKLSINNQVLVESVDVVPGVVATESALVNKDLQTVSFNLKVIGEIDKTIRFINSLEEALPLINVRLFKIEMFEQFSKAEVSFETFLSGGPEKLGKVDVPIVKLTKKEEELYDSLGKMLSYSEGLFPSESFTATPSSGGRADPFVD